jgi:hypothetical protein
MVLKCSASSQQEQQSWADDIQAAIDHGRQMGRDGKFIFQRIVPDFRAQTLVLVDRTVLKLKRRWQGISFDFGLIACAALLISLIGARPLLKGGNDHMLPVNTTVTPRDAETSANTLPFSMLLVSLFFGTLSTIGTLHSFGGSNGTCSSNSRSRTTTTTTISTTTISTTTTTTSSSRKRSQFFQSEAKQAVIPAHHCCLHQPSLTFIRAAAILAGERSWHQC